MPSSSIGGISWGSGRRIEGVSSRFCFFVDFSFSGAASRRGLFGGALGPWGGFEKSIWPSLGGRLVDWLSFRSCLSGFRLENVVKRADCRTDVAEGVWGRVGDFFVGESVVNI